VAPASGLVATVALAPVADLVAADDAGLGGGAVRDFLGVGPQGRGDLDPVRVVSAAGPVTIVHGVDDLAVPIAQSEAYVAAHPATRLRSLPGVGHFDLIDPATSAWPDVLAALREATT